MYFLDFHAVILFDTDNKYFIFSPMSVFSFLAIFCLNNALNPYLRRNPMDSKHLKKILAGFAVAGLVSGANMAKAGDQSESGSSSCSGTKTEGSKTGCSGKTGCGGGAGCSGE